jgi:hypothetical protein
MGSSDNMMGGAKRKNKKGARDADAKKELARWQELYR